MRRSEPAGASRLQSLPPVRRVAELGSFCSNTMHMLNAATVRSLPKPTDAQLKAFAEHLVTVHSWYKHLPLFAGGEFVVFVAPDAGERYPTEHPRLPTENTLAGYRRAFGHLDYIYRAQPHEPFSRDGLPIPELDDELLDVGRFDLFPYVSNEFYWSVHEDDVARIRHGVPHPQATAILHAYDTEERVNQYWSELAELDREIISSINDTDTAIHEGLWPDSVLRYLDLERTAAECYHKLQEPEILKIQRRVNLVRQWLG